MPNNEELVKLNEQLLAAHSKVEKAMREAEESKKLAEDALSKANRAEERAKKNYERFIRKAFLTQLKEFLGGAPVIMDVFHDDKRKLPPEDEPDKYGCRFLITEFKKRAYVSGEYASLSPIEEDFFDVINGRPPMQKPYDGWSPSVSNIPFMPKNTIKKWVPQRYVPIHKFETMREIFQRNYDKFIDGVKTQIASWKKELDGPSCIRLLTKTVISCLWLANIRSISFGNVTVNLALPQKNGKHPRISHSLHVAGMTQLSINRLLTRMPARYWTIL